MEKTYGLRAVKLTEIPFADRMRAARRACKQGAHSEAESCEILAAALCPSESDVLGSGAGRTGVRSPRGVSAQLVVSHPEDFAAVSPGKRRRLLQLLLRCRENPFYGPPLRDGSLEGRHRPDLRGCRKLKVKNVRAVYRLLPDEKNPVVVDVVAVGARDEERVYVLAGERLAERRLAA